MDLFQLNAVILISSDSVDSDNTKSKNEDLVEVLFNKYYKFQKQNGGYLKKSILFDL